MIRATAAWLPHRKREHGSRTPKRLRRARVAHSHAMASTSQSNRLPYIGISVSSQPGSSRIARCAARSSGASSSPPPLLLGKRKLVCGGLDQPAEPVPVFNCGCYQKIQRSSGRMPWCLLVVSLVMLLHLLLQVVSQSRYSMSTVRVPSGNSAILTCHRKTCYTLDMRSRVCCCFL